MKDMQSIPFSVAILAGGQSQRMGQNKALLEVGGIMILQRVIDVVKELTSDLFLVTNTPQLYEAFCLPMAPDIVPGAGSLGGIYTASFQAHYEWVLVLACDMPLLNPKIITFLAGYCNRGDVVCPLVESYPETLHAFYRKTCLPVIKKQIAANKLKISGIFDELCVQYVNKTRLATVSSNFNFLLNINTPEDLTNVRKLIKIQKKSHN